MIKIELKAKMRPAYLLAMEDHGDYFLLRFGGDVSLHALEQNRDKMTAVIEEFELNYKAVLCDFLAVTNADTVTVAALIQRFNEYRRSGGKKLIFFNIQGVLQSLFEIAHLQELYIVRGTQEEAQAALLEDPYAKV